MSISFYQVLSSNANFFGGIFSGRILQKIFCIFFNYNFQKKISGDKFEEEIFHIPTKLLSSQDHEGKYQS